MCGRFFRHSPREELAAAFQADPTGLELGPSYNVAPGQSVLIVRHAPSLGRRVLDTAAWGLVPHFAKDTSGAYRCINARAETVDTKPSYRSAFSKRRCLLIADGFFEWRAEGRRKLPYAIALKTRKPFAIAGLWETWRDPTTDQKLQTCALVTTDANELVASIHNRMPVILDPDQCSTWLGEGPTTAPGALKSILRPFPPDEMLMWPVSPQLNTPRFDEPELLEPFLEQPKQLDLFS